MPSFGSLTLTLCLALPNLALAGSATELISGEVYSEKWIVILGSYENNTDVPASLSKLQAKPKLATGLARIDSSEFKGLMPCYQVLIAGGFKSKKAARALHRKLKKIGVDAYFKNAGKWVGKLAKLQAYCKRRGAKPPKVACGNLHWVERWDGRTFMQVPVEEPVFKRLTQNAPQTKPLGKSMEAWTAKLQNEVIGPYRTKTPFKLYGQDASEPVASCMLDHFVLLTRGTPHFGWMQMHEEEGKKPKKPGCGEPALFAELKCNKSGQALFAVADGHRGPRFYKKLQTVPGGGDQVVAALKKSATWQAALDMAGKEARDQKRELKEQIATFAYRAGTRTVVLAKLSLVTGDGMTECGADDLRLDLRALVEVDPRSGTVKRELLPLTETEQSTVKGVIDADGSGALYLLETLFPNTTRLVPADHAGAGCAIEYAFCDCPC